MTETTGRLEIVRDLGMPILRTKARRVAKPIYEGGSEDREVDGNARRLAACWNACIGITFGTDDRLPDGWIVQEFGDYERQITTLTDALTEARAALHDLHYFLDGFMPKPADHERVDEYDAQRNPWVQCSSNEEGHMEGFCPQDVDDDADLLPALPFGELRAFMEKAEKALATPTETKQ